MSDKKIDFRSMKAKKDASESETPADFSKELKASRDNAKRHQYVIDYLKSAIKHKFNRPHLKFTTEYGQDYVTVSTLINANMYVSAQCYTKYLLYNYKVKYSPSPQFAQWINGMYDDDSDVEPPIDVTTFECDSLGRLVQEAEIPLTIYEM